MSWKQQRNHSEENWRSVEEHIRTRVLKTGQLATLIAILLLENVPALIA